MGNKLNHSGKLKKKNGDTFSVCKSPAGVLDCKCANTAAVVITC